jgi:hypothetical protein
VTTGGASAAIASSISPTTSGSSAAHPARQHGGRARVGGLDLPRRAPVRARAGSRARRARARDPGSAGSLPGPAPVFATAQRGDAPQGDPERRGRLQRMTLLGVERRGALGAGARSRSTRHPEPPRPDSPHARLDREAVGWVGSSGSA